MKTVYLGRPWPTRLAWHRDLSAAWQHAFDDVTPGASLAFATTGIGFGIDGVSYSGQFADEVTDNAVKGRPHLAVLSGPQLSLS
ncbi:MAG TPA: hypothetical protein VNO69_06005 [Methyloceanibacter sp.]|nr:hypothetical protein [Methyloceanibacter sp.]